MFKNGCFDDRSHFLGWGSQLQPPLQLGKWKRRVSASERASAFLHPWRQLAWLFPGREIDSRPHLCIPEVTAGAGSHLKEDPDVVSRLSVPTNAQELVKMQVRALGLVIRILRLDGGSGGLHV